VRVLGASEGSLQFIDHTALQLWLDSSGNEPTESDPRANARRCALLQMSQNGLDENRKHLYIVAKPVEYADRMYVRRG
jgi:hypothetical protein